MHPHSCPQSLSHPAVPVQELRKVLKAEFPGIRQVETRSLHKAVPQAHHAFQAMQPGEDKLDRLLLVCPALHSSLETHTPDSKSLASTVTSVIC